MGEFSSIQEVFEILHTKKINYAVLRNYNNLLEDNIYMDGHGDIDIICADSKAIVTALDAYSNDTQEKDGLGNGTHYFIYLKNKKVSLDLRHVGDDYYCEKWQRNMLINKVWNNGFYILGKNDHFYSLVYHAILQKPQLNEEYRNRLKKMALDLNIKLASVDSKGFIYLLEDYMRKNSYNYVYPVDHYVFLKTGHIIDKNLVIFNKKRYFQHKIFELKISIIDEMVKIKHLLVGSKTKSRESLS